MIARFLILLIRFYQLTLSPFLGSRCRFDPSCSAYAATCIAQFGALKGTWLGFLRIIRCHPFGGFGFDPPPKIEEGKGSIHYG